MAHPPALLSDLTFEHFLAECVAAGSKHLKLDFKSSAAVEPCLAMLAAAEAALRDNGQAVWLNADCVGGPNQRRRGALVPAKVFLPLCKRLCPFAFLSLSWRVGPFGPEEAYTVDDIFEMERLCREHGLSGPQIVFAASVRLAEMSMPPLI